jgi:hypothetical protein
MGRAPSPHRPDALYGPTIVGLFHEIQPAQAALGALRDAGLSSEQLSIVARREGGAGGIPGWLPAAGTVSLPGTDQADGAGPLVADSAAAGSLVSALLAIRVAEEDALAFVQEVGRGDVLVVVQSFSDDQGRGAYTLVVRAGTDVVRAYGLSTGEPVGEMPALLW